MLPPHLYKCRALVTGAGSRAGIGFASARALGLDGAALALVSTTDRIHERAAELQAEGIRARGYVADLTQPASVQRIVDDLRAEFGRLEICVNNAGMTVVTEDEQLESPVDDLSLVDWEKSLARNLTTCFLVTKAVLPLMRAQKYGRIINIASTSGPVQAFVGDSAYPPQKPGCGVSPAPLLLKPLLMASPLTPSLPAGLPPPPNSNLKNEPGN